ncbi:ABC transporter ATP-binding protein [Ahrensia kielensis]|uniref:ABC transporter ATP-binding protein n=1 Tax=Ahrensia kielensis TaxID=76980 RepID=UPI00036CD176|nr:ABC transporter ATP-binding protein [Ahrensia kielensis]
MSAAKLNVINACWNTRRGDPILKPLSLSLNAGRVMGVVGANGAGKSTFLRLLYRYQKPSQGRIEIDGRDIWALSPRLVAQNVAAVLQEQPTDFALTVREIVELGRTPYRSILSAKNENDSTIVDSALRKLELSEFASRRFGTLSGGERQRAMVARALAQEPNLLILDEPTNHLDIRHQLEIIELIRDLDMTIVTSLHDLNMAAGVCDEILLLKQGSVLAFGPPETVLTNQSVSYAFNVSAQSEKLMPTDRLHFTYTLMGRT